MPAYVIVDVTVTNQAEMDEYRTQVPATLATYGAGHANLIMVEGVPS